MKIAFELDRQRQITRAFLAAVLFGGLVYIGFGWTPSSYGNALELLQANGEGPVAGTSRYIRTDEWAVETPYFQAAVRNHFQRINETSFYHEDLRNYYPLPLADWSLAFKPYMWAFFILPPASAFSIFHAFWLCAFLAGYYLFFLELKTPAWLAVGVTLILFFSGFVQFWWTTYGPLLAGLPWILLAVIHPMPWWKKTLLCAWALPAFVLSHVYPTLLVNLAWGALFLILAFRPSLLRSRGDIAAILTGVAVTLAVVYGYYMDVIPVMRNTVYPGHRISPAGTTPVLVALSELFPFLAIRISDYLNLAGQNICEVGTVGSFFPLLTLCLTRYRSLRRPSPARTQVLILLAGFAAITLWEIAPIPGWIGSMLFWNTGDSGRWLFTSGLLLLLGSLVIWNNQLISTHPARFTLFVLLGPVALILLKSGSSVPSGPDEFILCAMLLITGVAAWYIPPSMRAPALVAAIALANVYAFGRFNPLQPAGPIFGVPDTPVIRELRKEAAANDGVLVDTRPPGVTQNGLGFRSVNHTLLAPRLAVLRPYFPAMDPQQFNQIFNRYAYIVPADIALPRLSQQDSIYVPMEVFVRVRNVRRLVFGAYQSGACSQPPTGGVDRVSAQGDQLIIEGSAPWVAETDAQGIRVLSARSLRAGWLTTITRPDIAEKAREYRFVKSGFKLQISSADGKPLRPQDVVVSAFGTAGGEIRLACCACP